MQCICTSIRSVLSSQFSAIEGSSSFFPRKSIDRYLAILSMVDRCVVTTTGCVAHYSVKAICWRISIAPLAAGSGSFICGAWDTCPPSTLAGLFGRFPWSSSTLRGVEPSILILLRLARSASESCHPLYANVMYVINNFKFIL